MVDSNDHTDRDVESLRNAEVRYTVPNERNPEVYLVEFEDGSVEHVNATPTNQILFGEGLFEKIVGEDAFYIPGIDEHIVTYVDVQHDFFALEFNNRRVNVPQDERDRFVEAFTSQETGTELFRLYSDLTDEQIRRTVVERFLEQFPEDRIEVTEDGWVVDDTFIVTYEVENYFVDNRQIYIPRDRSSRTGVVEADESKEAITLNFPQIDGQRAMVVDGDEMTLMEDEQEFLATVEILLHPGEYLNAHLAENVEELREYGQTDSVSELIDGVSVSAFTDSRSGVHHNHKIDKHRLSEEFSVTQEALDEMYSAEYDHLALHELLVREPQFRRAPYSVFSDTDNDDDDRWDSIRNTADGAPVSANDIRELQEMFEGEQIEITSGY